MNAREAVEWLAMDVGEDRPDMPASNGEALQRALGVPAKDFAKLLAVVHAGVTAEDDDPLMWIARAFVFGARLGRHAADLERIGDRS